MMQLLEEGDNGRSRTQGFYLLQNPIFYFQFNPDPEFKVTSLDLLSYKSRVIEYKVTSLAYG